MRACALLTVLVTQLTIGCDRADRQIEVPSPRVVTFSPALTKIVFDLGLGDHVVGVTSFCRLPQGERRQVVGNALSVRIEPILAVDPELVMVQMEVKHFEPLQRLKPNVRIEHFEIETLDDVATAIQRVGALLQSEQLGTSKSHAFRKHLERTSAKTESLPKRRVLFVSGYIDPLVAGKGTFLDEMIFLAGGENALGRQFDGWQRPTLEAVVATAPEIVFCLCDSGQEVEAGAYWTELEIPGNAETSVVTLTDQDWTLPAAHLAEYTERLAEMIHPELEDAASP